MLLVLVVLMEKEMDMSSFKLLFSPRILTVAVFLFTVLLQVQQLMAADRLFFSGLVSRNEDTHALDTTIIWVSLRERYRLQSTLLRSIVK